MLCTFDCGLQPLCACGFAEWNTRWSQSVDKAGCRLGGGSRPAPLDPPLCFRSLCPILEELGGTAVGLRIPWQQSQSSTLAHLAWGSRLGEAVQVSTLPPPVQPGPGVRTPAWRKLVGGVKNRAVSPGGSSRFLFWLSCISSVVASPFLNHTRGKLS